MWGLYLFDTVSNVCIGVAGHVTVINIRKGHLVVTDMAQVTVIYWLLFIFPILKQLFSTHKFQSDFHADTSPIVVHVMVLVRPFWKKYNG